MFSTQQMNQEDISIQQDLTTATSAGDVVDRSYLRDLLIEAFEAAENAIDKDIVLVIGNTGAGKSTTINYLLGCPMEERDNDETGTATIVVSPGAQEYAVIGHNISISETVYPKVFDSGADFFYCDCPGFAGTRRPEYPICEAIATKIAVNSSRSVKSIVVVIEQDTITAGRGSGLRSVFQTLQSFLSQSNESRHNVIDAKQLKHSIIFVITKLAPRKKTIGLINKIKRERSGDETAESKNILLMCNLILNNQDSLIEIDPVDNGESRKKLFNRIRQTQPLSPDCFGFPAEANTKRELRDLLGEIAASGIQLLTSIIQLPEAISNKIKAKQMEDQALLGLNQRLSDLNNQTITEDDDSTQAISQLIDGNDERLARKLEEKRTTETRRSTLQHELETLDSPEQVEYWRDVYDEQKIFGTVKQGIRNTTIFKYVGSPFDRPEFECSGEGSEFGIPTTDPQNGTFSIKYTTGPWVYGIGRVKIFVQKRQMPENIRSMTLKQRELQAVEEEIARFSTDIRELEQHTQHLIDQLVQIKKESSQSALEYKELLSTTFVREKEEVTTRIQRLNDEISASEKLLAEAQQNLPTQIGSFELVRKIAPVIGKLGSTYVTQFLKLYEEYKVTATDSNFLDSFGQDNPVFTTLMALRQHLHHHYNKEKTEDAGLTAEQAILTEVSRYLCDGSGPVAQTGYCLNDQRQRQGFYPVNATEQALRIRLNSYVAAARLLVTHINFVDKKSLLTSIEKIIEVETFINDAKSLFNIIENIASSLKTTKVQEKPYNKWSRNHWLTALDQAEYLINQEKQLRNVITLTESNDYVFVQVDAPILALTASQQDEYFQLASTDQQSDLSEKMFSWEQSYWRERIMLIRQQNIINLNTEFQTFPSTFIKYPGIAFYLHHHFLVFKKQDNGACQNIFHIVRARSSVLHPYSRQEKAIADRIREENFDQLLAAELPLACSRILSALPQQSQELPIIIPMLMTTNLSPVAIQALERMAGGKETGMVDRNKATQSGLAKRYAISEQLSIQFIASNIAINKVRMGSPNPLFRKVAADTRDPAVVRAIIVSIVNYFSRLAFSQNTQFYKPLLTYLCAFQNEHEKIESSYLRKLITSSHGDWQLQDALLIMGLAEYLQIYHAEIDKKFNQELVLSTLEKLLIACTGGVSHSTCKSGKDRTAMMLLYEDSIITYMLLYKQFPPLTTLSKERTRFVEIFAALFVSGHHQLLASSNASGSFGLKSIEDVLPADIYQYLTTNYPLFIQSNDFFACLNRRKGMKKIDSIVQAGNTSSTKEIHSLLDQVSQFPVVRVMMTNSQTVSDRHDQEVISNIDQDITGILAASLTNTTSQIKRTESAHQQDDGEHSMAPKHTN